MGSDYVSQIVLLPQHADWRWYKTLRPYLEQYRITVTKSADDAGSFHGRDHTVTILESPQAWPSGIVPFFQTRYPQAKLDYVPFQSLRELSNLIAARLTQGEAGRVLSGGAQGPFGPAAAALDYDSHIVLLPNGCDWQWYEAVQRYVLHYRVTIAQSADDAGSFHGRNHVVTAIIFPGAYNADLRAWFQQNYPNAQFDPIEINTPAELRARLDKRVAHGTAGRFGQGEPYADDPQPWELEPFRLRWPMSDVRQPARSNFSRLFTASPWGYRPGLIAHEGLDFPRATGAPVLAGADGEVIEREVNRQFYGQYVRLRHIYGAETYETVYAHLSAISVGPIGTIVKAGDPIGLVGDTGRAFGPHLHFNLERPVPAIPTPHYRKNFLDPSLYLTWPDGYTLERREELPHIFGVHEDVAREHPLNAGRLMQQAGVRGYVLWTEALTNLDDTSGINYTLRATGDHTVIVRLNYGYEPDGTLPPSAQYDRFARRCGDFARNSQGVSIYVIANEMNNPREWPQGQPISPENYAACFNLVYRRIKEADPQAVVCPGAIDPYNGQWGDMREYWRRMLENITACDGLAVHAYTHGPDPSLVEDQSTFGNAPLLGVRFNFWVFEDVLKAAPARFRALPVYLTETDHIFIDQESNLGWKNVNNGWIWAMYQQVDDWNKRGGQQIHAALVYRYPQLDQWSVVDKPNVVQDFQQALTLKYKPYHWRL